jgi:hypothetical protein
MDLLVLLLSRSSAQGQDNPWSVKRQASPGHFHSAPNHRIGLPEEKIMHLTPPLVHTYD